MLNFVLICKHKSLYFAEIFNNDFACDTGGTCT